MPFELLANATFIAHGVFAVVAVPSAYLAYSGAYYTRRTLWVFHNLCIAIMVAGQLAFRQCPLVTLEEAFRGKAGTDMWYEGSFVRYVVGEVVGVSLPNASVTAASLTIVVLSLWAIFRHSTPSANSALAT